MIRERLRRALAASRAWSDRHAVAVNTTIVIVLLVILANNLKFYLDNLVPWGALAIATLSASVLMRAYTMGWTRGFRASQGLIVLQHNTIKQQEAMLRDQQAMLRSLQPPPRATVESPVWLVHPDHAAPDTRYALRIDVCLN